MRGLYSLYKLQKKEETTRVVEPKYELDWVFGPPKIL